MKNEKMPMISTASVIINAPLWMKKLAMPATSTRIAPMNMNLAMFDRSRLTMVDSVAMPRKMAPVPAKAIMIRLAPLPMPSTTASMRDSITPMKKVKASRIGTPAAEFLFFSIANMKPNAPTRKTIRPITRSKDLVNAHGHADPGTQDPWAPSKETAPVGVAKDAVAFAVERTGTGGAGIDGLQAVIHLSQASIDEKGCGMRPA